MDGCRKYTWLMFLMYILRTLFTVAREYAVKFPMAKFREILNESIESRWENFTIS